MKFLLIFFISVSVYAFNTETVYECKSTHRYENELSEEEQKKSSFQLYIKDDRTALKTSNGLIYKQKSTNKKSNIYTKTVNSRGRLLYYKIEISPNNSLFKSVYAKGYGNLIKDLVVCKIKKEGI